MKSSLTHLPEKKQFEIKHIAEIIREVINPEMIILFGSYAKGKQVEHRYTGRDGSLNEYISDYDFLVVTKKVTEETSDQEWAIEERCEVYDIPVNLEIHEIDFINEGLEKGQYFFTDILKEGILLFDKSGLKFSEPKQLTTVEKKQIAKDHFDTWFPKGLTFLKTAKYNFSEGDFKLSAFLLHQTAESLYYATLLVFTDYKPKTHNLKKLRNKAKHLSEELYLVFQPEYDKVEKHLFDLLKKGYVDARYRRNYSVTKEELEQLIDRLTKIKKIVEEICLRRITEL
jgi:uncharacterized protein